MATERPPFPDMRARLEPVVIEVPAPARLHPAEPDVFARHNGVLGHDQELLASKHVTIVGAGGIGSWVAVNCVRLGFRRVLVIDGDPAADATNLPRQLFKPSDRGLPKAVAVARSVAEHAIAGATITAVPLTFEEALDQLSSFDTDVIAVGTDNNASRAFAARWAREHGVAAVFTMLSPDGSFRCISFSQGPDPVDACLWCAFPDLDPDQSTPCVAAMIPGCMLSGALTATFIYRAIMGWPREIERFNLRDVDLLGRVSDRAVLVPRRPGCWLCGPMTRSASVTTAEVWAP